MTRKKPPLESREMEDGEFKNFSRRRVLGWGAIFLSGLGGLRWLFHAEEERGQPWPLRRMMDATDSFWKANFNEQAKAPKTPETDGPIRMNGDIGMDAQVDSDWKLRLIDPEMEEPTYISLDQIKKWPAITESFEFKCIEGWSRHVTCKGVRFADFLAQLSLGQNSQTGLPFAYAQLRTINNGYYVSMDMKSLLHPQTMLCYEMNGRPLAIENGYPLRLITPVKYGVKNIKQIGTIAFMDSPPADFWAEQGYGDYLGL